MVIADNRHRQMPLPEDLSTGRGQPLAYPEAVQLVNPTDPEHQREVLCLHQFLYAYVPVGSSFST